MFSVGRGGVLLLVVFLVHLAHATFTWSDCGIPLYKDIHYEVASISAAEATEGSPLSVNVKATISQTIYNAYTRVLVWKDGEMFLDVRIDDLCDIIATTKGLSCPLQPGQVSFTYEFDSVPALPSGDYTIDIRSDMGSIIEPSNVGCIEFNISVDSVRDSDPKSCSYTSMFSVDVAGNAVYTQPDITLRKQGDSIKVGPIDTGSTNSYGTFTSQFKGTKDLGGSWDLKDYFWAINGTLASRQDNFTSVNRIVDVYTGNFLVLHSTSRTFSGKFNWTFDYDPERTTRKEMVTGNMWFDPEYYIVDQLFDWPVVLANLGPFQVVTASDAPAGTFTVQGSHSFCTCGTDECGVCNGDGSTCGLGLARRKTDDDGMGVRKRAAIGCGVAAFLLILVVIYLAHRIRKEKRRIPNDDEDLIDHPEKPDYGTMAIDDAIREGERV